MPKFCKKPVVVEARQFTAETASDVYAWVETNTQGSFNIEDDARPANGVSIDPATGRMVIATLEGDMYASLGDWIIRGVQGEFYPCKPEIFEATYEPVPEDEPAGDHALFVGVEKNTGRLFTTNGGQVLYGPRSFFEQIRARQVIPIDHPLVGGAYMSLTAKPYREMVFTVRGDKETFERVADGMAALAAAIEEGASDVEQR